MLLRKATTVFGRVSYASCNQPMIAAWHWTLMVEQSISIYIWYIVVTSFQKTTWLCWTCVVQTSVSKSKFPTTNLHGLLYALFLGAPHSPEVSSHLVGRRLDHRLKRDPFTWLEKKTNTLCCSNILFWGKILLKSVSQWFFRILAYFVCNFKNKPRT